tara:strand:- start:48501 stop:48677 length:177 start_codon:yes stop_codon:yes gene_type:complete
MNIHLKIEMKKAMAFDTILPYAERLRLGINHQTIYKALNCSFFLLPYKVYKLSKKARR